MGRRPISLILLALVGCTGSPATQNPSIPRPSTPAVSAPGGSAEPGFDFPQPAVWFAPAPPSSGPADYIDLFNGNGGWENAAGRLDVFQLTGRWVGHTATEDDFRLVALDLDRRGVAIALAARPLIRSKRCGRGLAGFAGPGERPVIVDRLKRLGRIGRVFRFLAFDAPFASGRSHEERAACGWSARRIARQVAAYARSMRADFPEIRVGDVEPLDARTDPKELEAWIETYRRVTGSPFDFFHVALAANAGDWIEKATELASFCRRNGIAFGIVYGGEGDADQAWSASVEERFIEFEAKAGGRPDDVVIQSGTTRPSRLLPETEPGTLTHLLDRYFRTRTALDMEVGPSEYVGSIRAAGTLLDQAGFAIPNAAIRITLTKLDEPGVSPIDLGTRVTDGRGYFKVTFHEPGVLLHLGRVRVQAWFPGDVRRWPAYAGGSVDA